MNTMTPLDEDAWTAARRTVHAAMRSSLCCTITSVDPDGSPHATPIGSLTLSAEPGKALYFDVLNARLSRNVDRDPRVCILAVDSRKFAWLRAFTKGRFSESPGVQFDAVVGARRPATADELGGLRAAVGPLMYTRGGRALWGDVRWARDVTIESIRPIRLGPMTRPEPQHPADAARAGRPR